jgi:hypothetical protein
MTATRRQCSCGVNAGEAYHDCCRGGDSRAVYSTGLELEDEASQTDGLEQKTGLLMSLKL